MEIKLFEVTSFTNATNTDFKAALPFTIVRLHSKILPITLQLPDFTSGHDKLYPPQVVLLWDTQLEYFDIGERVTNH